MKRNFTLEIVERSPKMTLYSIRFSENTDTEFETFIKSHIINPIYKEDLSRIVYYLDKIKVSGALERYFRNEGKMKHQIKALPIEVSKLRLYCLRITDNILILGNGGRKKSRTYNEDPLLNEYVEHLTQLSFTLRLKMDNGSVFVEGNQLKGNLSFFYKNQ